MKLKRLLSILCIAAMTVTSVAVVPFALPEAAVSYAVQSEEQSEEGTKAGNTAESTDTEDQNTNEKEGSVLSNEVQSENDQNDSETEAGEKPEAVQSEEVQQSAEEPEAAAAAPRMLLGLNNAAAGQAYGATATAAELNSKPGVYYVQPGADTSKSSTINIPSLKNLSAPTAEMPAIITGAAVNYEIKTAPTVFTPIAGKTEADLVAPYKYFRWSVIEEPNKDGTPGVHRKLSGFDGSYYIVRVNVSDIISAAGDLDAGELDGKFLHVKQENNKAIIVAAGMAKTAGGVFYRYTDQLGTQTASFSLADAAAEMKDADGSGPYFDVILISSAKNAAGGDAQKEGAQNGDVDLSFYIDGLRQYNDLEELPTTNPPTFPHTFTYHVYSEEHPEGVETSKQYADETAYKTDLMKRFFDPDRMTASYNCSGYKVLGSELEVDVAVDNVKDGNTLTFPVNWMTARSEGAKFWSMAKAIVQPNLDDHTIMLICEVPVLENLSIAGSSKRSVVLDVNSFDIQIANNKQDTKGSTGLTIGSNSQLRIKDGTKTSGAELAVGNNATMLIEKGGILIIDESCTIEAEYDAATVAQTEPDPGAGVLSGEITVKDGGTLINEGVVNIEGSEGKPIDQTAPQQTDMKTASILVEHGGVLDNYGCLSLKGVLYILGTLNNYGKYNDSIVAHDPDKGDKEYHRGIQITWKDDVTQPGVEPGVLNVGIDENGNIDSGAVLNNYGDIVLCPGTFNNYGTFNNLKTDDYAGHLYLCTMTEAVIPINPTVEQPNIYEKRITLNPPKESYFNNYGTVNDNGYIGCATVEIISNGVLGKLTPINADVSTYPGTVHTVSGSRYEVLTDANGTTPGTVALVKAKNTKNFKVPSTVTLYGKTFLVTQINAKAFTGKKIRTVTLGKNVIKLKSKAFGNSKVTTIIVKTKKLTKKSVKGSLKGSVVRTIKVKVGSASTNSKYVKKYRKIFTAKNCGKKVTVRRY